MCRPSARELLKHRFVKMAKKTNYLTELIDRHERWKPKGGGKHDEEERDAMPELPTNLDAEELWDFGRSTACSSTVGRSQAYRSAAGDPLTLDNEDEDYTNGIHASGSPESPKHLHLMPKKEDLSPLPPSAPPTPKRFRQGTVRHAPLATGGLGGNKQIIERESSDEYDEYDEQFEGYPAKVDGLAHQLEGAHLDDDDLADTTLLDSVVLPAIASLFPRVSSQEARVVLSTLQHAFTEAERVIPGVTAELVNEIVDSVERVEDDR
ncbi:hypothetical protein M378DRAFT_28621 [Amanita muscaria Koide BX008]|uniref:Programmed cell death protein 10 dimerisation domain-containing protein n=1 Tax=Amanita muscaria (strain Koide BX008) TaxID=946122 RepID=A0A0C2RXM2_AMAMK|nr:hypothetical protein M378DRAFT_28621 [Amanita muscaria Koide BX008]